MDVEKEIEELKELVLKNIEVTQETNRIVRKMRRGAIWSTFLRLVWWLVIVGATSASYYYIVQPQVDKIAKIYNMGQEGSQNVNNQVSNFLKFFQPHATTTK